MADLPYSGTPTVEPTSNPGGTYFNLRTPQVTPDMFGAATARGLGQLGQGAQNAAAFYGEAAADDAANNYQEGINKILHGDPSKSVTGADGKPTQDTGFLGLKGRAAMDARPGVSQQMDDLRKQILGTLHSPVMKTRFDGFARRYKTYADGEVGTYADNQSNTWYGEVNKASADAGAQHIANNADNPQEVLNGREKIRSALVKQAMLQGGGDELVGQAMRNADRLAVVTQANAIGVKDPAKALRILDNNKEQLGTYYDDAVGRLRPRAEQQQGDEVAQRVLTGQPPPQGDNASAVIRHYENFRDKAYQDNDGKMRVGYGSDTVTMADGTVVPTTADSVVTRADAERDLARRTAITQSGLQSSIGADKWNSLSPQARASLTSVSYNYGQNGFLPAPVLAAARSGNNGAVAQAIRGLASDNNGINASRRGSEANNISPADAGTTAAAGVRPQAEVMQEIEAMHLPPQAEARAMAQVNRSYAHLLDTQVHQRAAFNSTVKDSVAEALQTGTTTKPVAEADFVKNYGQQEGAAKYEDYVSDVKFGADTKSLQTMSNTEQEQMYNQRMAGITPGKVGYDRDLRNLDRLQKQITTMQKERRDDPAGAVAHMPAVASALATYDQKKPETFGLVASARLQAQAALGIDPEYRSPITKAEALQLTAPLATSIPGEEQKALVQVGEKFRTMFGAEAPSAMSYAVRARHVQGEVGQAAALVINKLSRNLPLTRGDGRTLDQARADAAEIEAVNEGMGSTQDRGVDYPIKQRFNHPMVLGSMDQPTTTEPVPTQAMPQPTPQNILYLRAHPDTANLFDKTFGTGMAKEALDRFQKAGAP